MSRRLFARAAKVQTLCPSYLTRNLSSAVGTRTAYIALGSNIGKRIDNIENACRELDKAGLKVSRTSHLYETEPMYYLDQAKFINGVCEVTIQGDLSPLGLLAKLKQIEESLGRQKLIEKGPRNIDLDILLYDGPSDLGGNIWESEELSIPHKGMLQRKFVLQPLCEIKYKSRLDELNKDGEILPSVTALGRSGMLMPGDSTRRTLIMSIVNATPDSFSDGGIHTDPTSTVPLIRAHIQHGASIIDIGGYSTRPGAIDIEVEEELHRVIPMVQAVAKLRNETPSLNISIDTFRHEVAEEAIKNGADIVNDVTAGLGDPKMLDTVASLGCTYIAMHMRGTPETMNSLNEYNHGVRLGVASELVGRWKAAEAAGVRRWRMILDPGLGFAKDDAQNLVLLRQLQALRSAEGLTGFPWLVGASRKSFIGRVTKVKSPSERIWGTAASVTASISGGADIVRVHDVPEMSKVVEMADAIYRSKLAQDK